MLEEILSLWTTPEMRRKNMSYNPIPEMLPNAGTNPDNIITTISGIGNDGGDW